MGLFDTLLNKNEETDPQKNTSGGLASASGGSSPVTTGGKDDGGSPTNTTLIEKKTPVNDALNNIILTENGSLIDENIAPEPSPGEVTNSLNDPLGNNETHSPGASVPETLIVGESTHTPTPPAPSVTSTSEVSTDTFSPIIQDTPVSEEVPSLHILQENEEEKNPAANAPTVSVPGETVSAPGGENMGENTNALFSNIFGGTDEHSSQEGAAETTATREAGTSSSPVAHNSDISHEEMRSGEGELAPQEAGTESILPQTPSGEEKSQDLDMSHLFSNDSPGAASGENTAGDTIEPSFSGTPSLQNIEDFISLSLKNADALLLSTKQARENLLEEANGFLQQKEDFAKKEREAKAQAQKKNEEYIKIEEMKDYFLRQKDISSKKTEKPASKSAKPHR